MILVEVTPGAPHYRICSKGHIGILQEQYKAQDLSRKIAVNLSSLSALYATNPYPRDLDFGNNEDYREWC